MLTGLNSLLAKLLNGAIALVHGAVLAILFAGVVSRYLFNAPLFWGEELAILGLVWLTFLGGAVLVRQDKNVTITLLADLLPAGVQKVLKLFAGALSLVVIGVMVVQSWFLMGRLAESTTPALRLSEAWFGRAVFAGFVLMFFYQLQRVIAGLLGKEAFPPDGTCEQEACEL